MDAVVQEGRRATGLAVRAVEKVRTSSAETTRLEGLGIKQWGDTLKLKRATFRYIESELYSYKDTLKEINRLRDEILFGSNYHENVGGGKSNIPSNPTEQIATRLLTHKTLRNLEEIANAITDVYNMVTDDHRKVIELKYFKNPSLTWDDVAYQLNMHRNTAFKLRREVIQLIANKLGLR